MFFWTGYLAENYLLAQAKLFSTIAEEEQLQGDKRLEEYGALEKRKLEEYERPGEKKGPEKNKKP